MQSVRHSIAPSTILYPLLSSAALSAATCRAGYKQQEKDDTVGLSTEFDQYADAIHASRITTAVTAMRALGHWEVSAGRTMELEKTQELSEANLHALSVAKAADVANQASQKPTGKQNLLKRGASAFV